MKSIQNLDRIVLTVNIGPQYKKWKAEDDAKSMQEKQGVRFRVIFENVQKGIKSDDEFQIPDVNIVYEKNFTSGSASETLGQKSLVESLVLRIEQLEKDVELLKQKFSTACSNDLAQEEIIHDETPEIAVTEVCKRQDDQEFQIKKTYKKKKVV